MKKGIKEKKIKAWAVVNNLDFIEHYGVHDNGIICSMIGEGIESDSETFKPIKIKKLLKSLGIFIFKNYAEDFAKEWNKNIEKSKKVKVILCEITLLNLK